MAEGNETDWRDICAAAAIEPNSERLTDLVDQLIKALDERDASSQQVGSSVEP